MPTTPLVHGPDESYDVDRLTLAELIALLEARVSPLYMPSSTNPMAEGEPPWNEFYVNQTEYWQLHLSINKTGLYRWTCTQAFRANEELVATIVLPKIIIFVALTTRTARVISREHHPQNETIIHWPDSPNVFISVNREELLEELENL